MKWLLSQVVTSAGVLTNGDKRSGLVTWDGVGAYTIARIKDILGQAVFIGSLIKKIRKKVVELLTGYVCLKLSDYLYWL